MFAVEIGKARRRLRTWVFAAGLALVAALPVIVLRLAGGTGQGGGPFFTETVHNGLFAAVAAIGLIQPFFLPLGTGLLAGEAIAAEASNGTLRYLLVRPVTRSRLVLAKYASVMALVGLAVLWVGVVGFVTGWIGFGVRPPATLSGQTIGVGPALVRIAATGAYVLAGVAGIAAVGVFLSTLTDSGIGAAAVTLSISIASQILDNLSMLHAIHPYLPTHGWLAYADLFRSPVAWDAIVRGLAVDAVYTAVFLAAALLAFGRRDVHS
jgi:ABC-2 type transport system permease protein